MKSGVKAFAFSKEQKGELYILAETVLWSLFPIIVVLTLIGIPPLVSLAWTNGISALFFLAVLLVKGTWRELANVRAWKYAILVTLFIGIGYYALFFIGLQFTTPGNAAILALFESLTTYALFNLLRGEKFPIEHAIGAIFMLVGAFIVIGKDFSSLALGDFLILAATCLSPFGNMYQKKSREVVSSETSLFLRSTLSTLAVSGLAIAFNQNLSLQGGWEIVGFLLVNGVLVAGLSKIFFLEGIHRISVTKAILLHNVTPLLTLLFAWLILSQAPTIWQISSLLPFILGVVLLTGQFRLKKIAQP